MRCDKCNSFMFHSGHQCFTFSVYDPCEDDTFVRHGFDAEEVAQKFAEDRNNAEPVLNENVFRLPIKITDSEGKFSWYNVYAEPQIEYSVSECSEPTKEEMVIYKGELLCLRVMRAHRHKTKGL